MKLKGVNVKKLPADKKKKMEETLKRMEQIRLEDTIRLRRVAEENIKTYKERIDKVTKRKQQLQEEFNELTILEYKLEGALIALSKLLNTTNATVVTKKEGK